MKSLRRSGAPSSPSPSSSSASASNSAAPISSSPPTSTSSWGPLRALFIVVPPGTSSSSDGGNLKSPWSRKKRKHALSPQQWNSLFTDDGNLRDGGIKLLKKVRSGGVDPNIRAEVWPFLLGVFELDSSKDDREGIIKQNRMEYEKWRKECYKFFKPQNGSYGDLNEEVRDDSSSGSPTSIGTFCPLDARNANESHFAVEHGENHHGLVHLQYDYNDHASQVIPEEEESHNGNASAHASVREESSDSESIADECESTTSLLARVDTVENMKHSSTASLPRNDLPMPHWTAEDFASWRRIIRLDALRVDADCESCPLNEDISMEDACHRAQSVGLKDYENLVPSRIYHAARLVEILESYAIYDKEIGYCQGMSDLLSPILAVIKEDHEAFWCFVGFMKKARDNFMLDEAGIKRQLKIVSNIIKFKDAHLYRHLQKLQAEDCFFVYRMVVVLFRRELTFEQTLCLWEVLWADQAAIRADIGKSAWGRIRPRAPPTDDLLLFAIAASVLQRRKLIIEKYSSMDEIVRECNNMTGQLDVWKLLDEAHDLVVTLHGKV